MNISKGLIIGGIFILGIFGGLLISQSLLKTKDQDRVLSITTQQELSSAAPKLESPTPELTAKVTKVIDGDTIVLESGQTVRLIGIDAPEKDDCFAKEATEELSRLIADKQIKLETDISETDRYNRLLRYIFIDQKLINDQLVRQGFAKAFPYPPDIKYQAQFSGAEQEAKENKKGLWVACGESTKSIDDKPGLSTYSKPGLGKLEDKDCKDFKTHAEAQAFFESQGPGDPHRLDSDGDGIACESLP